MVKRIRAKLYALKNRLLCIPRGYFTVTLLLFAAAVVIRLATGGTHIVYNVLQGRGAFPGPFAYTLLYFCRILLSGIVLTFTLYSHSACKESSRGVVFALLSTMLLLLEYKLIFGGVSIVLAVTFAAVSSVITLLAIIATRVKSKYVSICSFIFVLLQAVSIFQLISLAVCI
ncbi:MAG: hypothetical protein IKL24_03195 [Clostridia bacterium]|nr:hypothetical protein [Clostridia bacterium]